MAAFLFHMIYLANQINCGEHHLQTCQDAASQNEVRQNSMYNILMSLFLVIFWPLSYFYATNRPLLKNLQ